MENLNPDWLRQLAPGHAPPPPGWWPPAPGWWALVILVIAAGLIYGYRRSASRLRRSALRELDRLETQVQDDIRLAAELQDLMRRYAVAVYGREAVSGLSGADWLDFVVAHGGMALAGDAGLSLLGSAYGGRFTTARAVWINGVRDFLRGAR